MKVIIREEIHSKLQGKFQTKIDDALSDIKKRYREEEISAHNWYVSVYSKVDKIIVSKIKLSPALSVYIDVYSDNPNFDEDDVQGFANYLREILSYAGNPWIVPRLIKLGDDKVIYEDVDEKKSNTKILDKIEDDGLLNTIKYVGGYETFSIIVPDYLNTKQHKIDLINDIVEENDNRIYLHEIGYETIMIHERKLDDGHSLEHHIEFIERDVAGVAIWEYDEDGEMFDDMYDTYDIYLEELNKSILNKLFEKLVTEFLK